MSLENKLKNLNSKLEKSDIKAVEKVIEVDINEIQPNNNNFYEISNLEDLTESIRLNGQIMPILLRKIRNDELNNKEIKYVIIDGERRFRATMQLGFVYIKSIIIDVDNESIEKLTLIEANNTRIKSTTEKALEYEMRKNLYKELGLTSIRDYIAQEDSISTSQQTRYNKIIEMNEESRQLVDNKVISIKDIDKLKSNSEIDINEQVRIIAEDNKASKVSKNELEEITLENKNKKKVAKLINEFEKNIHLFTDIDINQIEVIINNQK